MLHLNDQSRQQIANSRKQRSLFLLFAVYGLLSAMAPRPAQAATLPTTLGWFSIPGTAYSSACPSDPSIQGNSGCAAVVDAWAGGAADTTRNWLVFTGGGHHDYWGNEVYALDLNTLSLKRLDNPSSIGGLNFNTQSSEALPDGTPSARHTYGGVAYITSSDQIFMFGGGISGIGDLSNVTWTLRHGSLAAGSTGACCWTRKSPIGGTLSSQFGAIADYDPNTDSIFVWTSWQSQAGALWQYTPSNNTYTQLATFGSQFSTAVDGYQSGVIDPVGKMFYAAGGGGGNPAKFMRISIAAGSNYQATDLTGASGCAAMGSGAYPGLAYDPIQNAIVKWNGGNSVVVYSIANNSCTTVTPAGSGPTTTGQNGTFGRFRYFPALKVFAVCNNWQENCFALRLTSGSPPPPPPPPPSPCDVNGDGSTNVADVQVEVNMALGISPCTNSSGTCTVISVQRVVNAALGLSCVSP